jgi:hypothetical protein
MQDLCVLGCKNRHRINIWLTFKIETFDKGGGDCDASNISNIILTRESTFTLFKVEKVTEISSWCLIVFICYLQTQARH